MENNICMSISVVLYPILIHTVVNFTYLCTILCEFQRVKYMHILEKGDLNHVQASCT